MTASRDYIKAFQAWLGAICTAYNGRLPTGVNPQAPYILYDAYTDKFGTAFIQPLTIHAPNSTDIGDVLEIVDEIDARVGEGGVLLHGEKLNIWIRKGSPFSQPIDASDEVGIARYVNLVIKIYQKER